MLVIVANSHDEMARRLAERWHNYGAGVLTPADLSKSGWRHYVASSSRSWAVVGGHQVPTAEITGVMTRMPCVYEHELAGIIPADRAYVGSEMTAFLHAWLSGLRCPVINRSTPNCLAGPDWRAEQWVRLAASLGMPVHRHRRKTASRSDPVVPEEVGAEVIVVGDRTFGDADPERSRWARELAGAAGVELLAVHFTSVKRGSRFLSANLWPNVESDDVADAIFDRLSRRASC